MMQYVNPDEVIKRLAAAQGIDVLNLVKSMDDRQQEAQEQQQQAAQMELLKQSGQFASSPAADPTKNPDAIEQIGNAVEQYTQPPEEGAEQ